MVQFVSSIITSNGRFSDISKLFIVQNKERIDN
jgi:hypothetical protein